MASLKMGRVCVDPTMQSLGGERRTETSKARTHAGLIQTGRGSTFIALGHVTVRNACGEVPSVDDVFLVRA